MTSKENTLSVTNFIASDADNIIPQEAQKDFRVMFSNETLNYLENFGSAYTFVDENNEIISICGVLPVKDVGITWAVHADSFKTHAREITRAVINLLDNVEEEGLYKTIKGSVIDGFEGGHKWMKILGFERGELHELGYHEYERKLSWEQ